MAFLLPAVIFFFVSRAWQTRPSPFNFNFFPVVKAHSYFFMQDVGGKEGGGGGAAVVGENAAKSDIRMVPTCHFL